ncbi:MAG: helix-turn-helix domain-containing protein [Clostridia bacterium]|nr:helix-turn-helix domain-containing protein [Clostridia bacterium]
MIKDENYYTVQGWMRNRLHLKGNDLHVYAMLYSFSQDGQSEFRGSLDYMSEFTGGSERNIRRSLNRLEENGLIEKVVYNEKTGKTNGFKCVSIDDLKVIVNWGGQNVHPPLDKMSAPVGQNVRPIPYNNIYNKVGITVRKKEIEKKNNKQQARAPAHEGKSHEEIMMEWGVPKPLRHELGLWLTSCYNKGHLVLNEVFEDLLGNLYDKYGNDFNAMREVVRNATESGYVRIVV